MNSLVVPIGRSLARPYTTVDKILIPLSAVLSVLLIASSVPIDDTVIGLFGLLSVMLRFSSKISFGLAVVCLIDVPLLLLLGNQSMSESFAIYAFYFLAIGVMNTLLEDQPERDYLAYRASKRLIKPFIIMNNKQAATKTVRTLQDTTYAFNYQSTGAKHSSTAKPKKKIPVVSG